jgi:hypothetical protein
MDEYLRIVTRFLGYRGDEGAPLTDILQHLAASGSFAVLPDVPEVVKDSLWNAILRETEAFQLHVPDNAIGGVTGATKEYIDGALLLLVILRK